ncbi:uncharacterized protein [Polyergus mexicanus]
MDQRILWSLKKYSDDNVNGNANDDGEGIDGDGDDSDDVTPNDNVDASSINSGHCLYSGQSVDRHIDRNIHTGVNSGTAIGVFRNDNVK